MPSWKAILPLCIALAAPAGAGAVERILVLPLENLARSPAGLNVVSAALEAQLASKGYEVAAGAATEEFLRSHRIRYLDSLENRRVEELLAAHGADAVLMGAVLSYNGSRRNPDVAIALRIVGRDGQVLWSTTSGISSMDTVRAFRRGGVGQVDDLARRLVSMAMSSLPAGQLPRAPEKQGGGTAGPSRAYRARELVGRELSICVLPLQNRAEERGAARTLEAILQQSLAERPGIRTVSPADLRRGVVEAELRVPSRLSADQMRKLGKAVGTSLFLQGTVFEYGIAANETGETPAVEIYLSLFDAETGRTVWSGLHRRTGLDYEGWLQFGAVNDLSTLASRVTNELLNAFTRD
jgi:hypothetical protein